MDRKRKQKDQITPIKARVMSNSEKNSEVQERNEKISDIVDEAITVEDDVTVFKSKEFMKPNHYVGVLSALNDIEDIRASIDEKIRNKSSYLVQVLKPVGKSLYKGHPVFFTRYSKVLEEAFVDPVSRRIAADEMLKPDYLHLFGDSSPLTARTSEQYSGILFSRAVKEQNDILKNAMEDEELAKKVISYFFATSENAVRHQYQKDLQNAVDISRIPILDNVFLMGQRAAHVQDYEEINGVHGLATTVAAFQYLVKDEMQVIP